MRSARQNRPYSLSFSLPASAGRSRGSTPQEAARLEQEERQRQKDEEDARMRRNLDGRARWRGRCQEGRKAREKAKRCALAEGSGGRVEGGALIPLLWPL